MFDFDGLEKFLNELDNEDLDSEIGFDLELAKKQIPNSSSQKLCDIVICNRYFGSYGELSSLAMTELGQRRVGGDRFEFETYINEGLKKLPPINFNIKSVTDLLKNFKK